MVEHFSMAGLAFGGETKELKEGLGRGEAREGGRASDFLRSIATSEGLPCFLVVALAQVAHRRNFPMHF